MSFKETYQKYISNYMHVYVCASSTHAAISWEQDK